MTTWRTTWTGTAQNAAQRAAAMRSGGLSQLPLGTRIAAVLMLIVIVLLMVGLVVVGLIVAVPLILIGVFVSGFRRLFGGSRQPRATMRGRKNVRVIEHQD